MTKEASATLGTRGFFLWAVLLLAAALTHASPHDARTGGKFPGDGGGYWMPGGGYGFPGWPGGGGGIPGYPGGGIPGYPGGGFPGGPGGKGWGNMGGGWGAGYGGPRGGYARGGVVRPSVVCRERGPCYGKKLSCPARCFSSYSHSGKNYGYGGGGGGCTMDCRKTCTAYC